MRISGRFSNFALIFCVATILLGVTACKGRTDYNVEPTGDTVEVVIMQDTGNEN